MRFIRRPMVACERRNEKQATMPYAQCQLRLLLCGVNRTQRKKCDNHDMPFFNILPCSCEANLVIAQTTSARTIDQSQTERLTCCISNSSARSDDPTTIPHIVCLLAWIMHRPRSLPWNIENDSQCLIIEWLIVLREGQ
jgi:hypothetical protein